LWCLHSVSVTTDAGRRDEVQGEDLIINRPEINKNSIWTIETKHQCRQGNEIEIVKDIGEANNDMMESW
jgi:hypothetical protein